MSELKAISGHEIREDIDYNTRGIDPEDKEWRNYGKELCDTLYYRKSEADKVIAEKDKEIARLDDLAHAHNIELLRKENVIEDLEESHKKEVGQLLIEIVKLKDVDSKNRSAYYKDLAMMAKDVERQKYKRCLAMAKWCAAERDIFNLTPKITKVEFFAKWHKRWLKIAEQFKEAK